MRPPAPGATAAERREQLQLTRPSAPAWLLDVARQLDAAFEGDAKKRSAGDLIVRALIHSALKGDVRSIRECLRLAERGAQARAEADAPTRRRRGRPPRRVDLAKVEQLARDGMKDLSKIARCLGVPKQTLLGPAHGDAVREAFETGRALFESDALREYADDIKHNRRNPLLIFKMKQLEWTDRQMVTGAGAPDVSGARDRLRALIEKRRALGAPS